MIVDSSAILAILNGEPESVAYAGLIAGASSVRMSAATLLETCIVADGHGDPVRSRRVDDFISRAGIEIVEVTEEQSRIGRSAYRDFGKGSGHPARLNFGDCFSYALAAVTGEALLFKGDGFTHTGIASAVPVSG